MSWYKKRKDIFKYYNVKYTDTYTEEMDTEGLSVLKWSMFDSPDKLGSGKMFMESAPVKILDEIFRTERIKGFIELGYTSSAYANSLRLPAQHPHRLGKAVRFRCINNSKRFRFIKGLIQYGIERITVSDESIYFDTDNYLKKEEFILLKKC
jgi:hypothetical protein